MPLRVVVPSETRKTRPGVGKAPIAWAASATGPRAENQDYYGRADHETPGYDWSNLGCLYVLADGMGGLACGAQAARMAVKEVIEHYKRSRCDVPAKERLAAAIAEANRKVYLAGQGAGGRMGSTIVACVLKDGHITIAHAGDSRAYLLRSGELLRCTTDHLYATEVLGMADEDAAKRSTEGHKITRALGKDPEISLEPDENEHSADDRFLLCSDGVSEALRDAQIRECLAQPTPKKAVQALMLSAGSHLTDNATAVVVFASGQKLRRRAAIRRASRAILITLLLAGTGLASYRYGHKEMAKLYKLLPAWVYTEASPQAGGPAETDSTREPTGNRLKATSVTDASSRPGDEGNAATKVRSGVKENGRAITKSHITPIPETKPATSSERVRPKPIAAPADGNTIESRGQNPDIQQSTPKLSNTQPGTVANTDHKQGQAMQPSPVGGSAAAPPPGSATAVARMPQLPKSAEAPQVTDPAIKKATAPANQQAALGASKPTSPAATGVRSHGTGKPYITITNNTGEKVEVQADAGGICDGTTTMELSPHETRQVPYGSWISPPQQLCWRKHKKFLGGGWQRVAIEGDGAVLRGAQAGQ